MVIVDTALARRAAAGNPVRVAMVGAGYMGRGIALQIVGSTPGMRLVAISNRTLSEAERAYREADVEVSGSVSSVAELEHAIENNRYVVTDDPSLLCKAGQVEAVIDTTGDAEFGAYVALSAIQNGKHLILMNAEVDASLGPILKVYADKAGVVYTFTDGDEPGVAMNLFRLVRSMGYQPVLMGQIKGFLDRYRNPDTQRAFAEAHQQKPAMIASYADGSKLALESVLMGNAAGFSPSVRGMRGHACGHVKELADIYKVEDFANGGIVDFTLGSAPHSGAFVMAYNDHPIKKQYMSYFKFGDGPLYVFYTPFHLPHMQLPDSVARAVLFNDATLAPQGVPTCDTMTVAKRDLKAGEVLDGMGGFMSYGLVDSYEACREGDFLPIALSMDCRLKRDVLKDRPVGMADIDLPPNRLCDKLRAEQTKHFAAAGATRVSPALAADRSVG